MLSETWDDVIVNPTDITDIRVQMALMDGKLDVITTRMEAGDRNSAQLITLVKDQLTYHAADLGELKAIVREASTRMEIGLSSIRVDLEAKISKIEEDVDEIRLWRAKLAWITGLAAMTGAAMTGAVVKAIS